MVGWIKIYRKISDNKLWTSESFTRGQAWIDLILLANHEYGYFYVRDHKIDVQRGQVGWSQLKLSERWKWSRTKLRKFLKDLEKEQQIIQHVSKSYSIIEIVNYDKYQQKEQEGIQQKNNRKTTEKQQKNTNKNNKEEKEEKKNKKELLFKQSIFEFKNEYSEEMLNNFFQYWSEPNKSNTKLKYELQATWDLNRRLKRWANNNFKTGDNGKNIKPYTITPGIEQKEDRLNFD